nr:MAG: hypothetical protein [Bacteriophage sp.]
MAIRTQQLAPVNYGDSNQLLRAAQQMILQGAGGLTDAFTGYRNAVVDRNTANVVNTLTGAKDLADLAQRQQTANALLQAAGGDINNEAVQRAQLTMPDTLINRQRGQNALTEFAQQQHDTPLINQAMALYAQGDSKGANSLLSQVQGDASKAVVFGAGRDDERFNRGIQQQQLGIQQAGLALRQQVARQRAAAMAAGAKSNSQLQQILKGWLTNNANALQESTTAAVKERNAQLADAEKSSPLNNPNNNFQAAVGTINDDSWFVNRGTRLSGLIDQLDPERTLTDAQRVNLLNGMNTVFEQNNKWTSNTNPDKAALDWGKQAIDALQNARKGRLENKQAEINQKRATQNAKLQVLLSALGSNGSLNPLALQILNDDEE